jgi:hypothetical protein
MNRTFEIEQTLTGWKLTMYEDGEAAGGGVGEPEDYDYLLEQAQAFAGVF